MGNKIKTLLVATLALAGGLFAQEKIAFVDSDKILNEFEDAKVARATLEQSVMQWRSEMDSLRRAYQTAEQEFKAQQPMLSEDALRARQQELTALRNKYETFAQDIWGEQGKVEQRHSELFAPVIDKMNEVIEQIATEKGISMVLDVASGGILYADVDMDITSDVLTELNREYAAIASNVKRKVAVFGIAALDEKSQSEGLGTQIRSTVAKVVESFETELNLEFISDQDVQSTLDRYGESFDRPMDEVRALNIGSALGADFAYMGTVQQQGGNIIVTLQIIKPQEREPFPPVSTTLSDNEKTLLDQKVAELVAQLKAYLIAETDKEEAPEEPIPEESK